ETRRPKSPCARAGSKSHPPGPRGEILNSSLTRTPPGNAVPAPADKHTEMGTPGFLRAVAVTGRPHHARGQNLPGQRVDGVARSYTRMGISQTRNSSVLKKG